MTMPNKQPPSLVLRIIVVGLCLCGVFGLQAAPAQAIGLSPVDIFANDILPGSKVTKELYISRADASEAAVILVSIVGEAAQYIKTPLGNELTLPAGEVSFTYPLVIEPGNLASGTYSAKINVQTTKPSAATAANEKGNVQAGTLILSGAQVSIIFTVSNKAVEEYTITGVEMASSEENQLVGFSYLMSNTGNVDARPAKIEFSVIDEIDPTNAYKETIQGEQLEIVPAFTDTSVTVATKAQLIAGLYNVAITFYNTAGELIYESNTLRLQIFPEGTLDQKGELADFISDKTSYQVAELAVLSATFNNIGSLGVNASLVVEIMKDGVRLDILKNEPIFIPSHQSATLEQIYKPTEGGKYTAVGYVNYGIFTTEKKEAAFTVEQLSNLTVAIFLGVILVGVGGIMFFIYHRRRKKNAPSQQRRTKKE